MKILKIEFSKYEEHFFYKQIKREGDVAIYEQRRGDNNDIMGYEVIIVQFRNEKIMPNGATVEAGEYYPTLAQWGNCGWTVFTEEAADKKMEELLLTRWED